MEHVKFHNCWVETSNCFNSVFSTCLFCRRNSSLDIWSSYQGNWNSSPSFWGIESGLLGIRYMHNHTWVSLGKSDLFGDSLLIFSPRSHLLTFSCMMYLIKTACLNPSALINSRIFKIFWAVLRLALASWNLLACGSCDLVSWVLAGTDRLTHSI